MFIPETTQNIIRKILYILRTRQVKTVQVSCWEVFENILRYSEQSLCKENCLCTSFDQRVLPLKAPRELFMSRHVFNTNPFANVSSLFTNLLLVPLDLVMIVTKFLAAFWLRNNSFVLQSWKYQFSLTIYLLGLTVVSILAIVLFFFSFLQHLHEPDIDLRRLNFQYLKDKQTSRWRFPKLTVVYRPVTNIFSSYFKYSFYSNMQEKLRFTARVIYLGNHKILNAVCYLWEIPL